MQHERERTASMHAPGGLDLPLAIQLILRSALQVTGADGGVVVFVGRAKEEFGPSVHVGVLTDDSYSPALLKSIERLGTGQHEDILLQSGGQTQGRHGGSSVAILPLQAEGEVLGVASLVARRSDAFPDQLRPFLESLASQTSVAVANALLHRDLLRRIKVLETVGQLTQRLRVAQGLDELLRLLIEEASRALGTTGAAALLLDASQTFLIVRVSQGECRVMEGPFPTKGSLLALPLDLGHFVVASQADLETFAQLTGVSGLRAMALLPLSTSAGQIGVLVLGRQQPAAFSLTDLQILGILSDVASTAVHRVRLRDELEEAYIGATLALAEAVDARDAYIAGHARRTGSLAVQVARMMGLPEDQVQDIQSGAILHDVGKISVPDSILSKSGPLNAQEWQVMRQHTIAGARILAPIARLSRAAEIVRYHHERWDGTGYPEGLKDDAIPLGARIVAVVDAYTAMIDERTYRRALSHDEALEELQRYAGTQFDPTAVAAFLRVARGGSFSY